MFGRSFGVFAAAVLMLSAISLGATYSGGDGSTANPYQINNTEDLLTLAVSKGDYNKNFILTADIDLAGKTFAKGVIASDAIIMSGFQGTAFTGSFDGNGFRITNLTINTNGSGNCYLGLFGCLGYEAIIKYLIIEQVSIIGGKYSKCLGGLCGENLGAITNCFVTGTVSSGDSPSNLGIMCGYNAGVISSCHAAGTIVAGEWSYYLGGLCGGNSATIINCYSAGSIIGGQNCCNIGGLCGWNHEGLIQNCYTTASILAGESLYSLSFGGLCGSNDNGVFIECNWNRETCGVLSSAGGWGLTDDQMKLESSYPGWNNGLWVIDEGVGYPHLVWEGKAGQVIDYERTRSYSGNGVNIPFELNNPEDIVCLCLRPADWDKKFILSRDIDMAFIDGYRPIENFVGSIDGQGHVIRNLVVDAALLANSNSLGLICRLGENGLIMNLGIENVQVIGGEYARCLGGLCGENYRGTIRGCYIAGIVSGGEFASSLGGLCGSNYRGIIHSCYTTVIINGSDSSVSLGGLCGNNTEGTVFNCYAVGRISGGSIDVGGLYGNNSGFNNNCFWDIQTTETIYGVGNVGIQGKTTSEMQLPSTFINAGWDFVGETANGVEEIWFIREGKEYPRFVWEDQVPIAQAGQDQSVHEWAYVKLDGSGSSDSDGDALTYRWMLSGKVIAAEAKPTVSLSAGIHTITLVVSDGIVESEPDEVVVTVLAARKGTLQIVPSTISRSSTARYVVAMFQLPSGVQKLDGKLVLYPGEVESALERAVTIGGKIQMYCWFEKQPLVDAIAADGTTELTIVGRQPDGQYVYARTRVTITK